MKKIIFSYICSIKKTNKKTENYGFNKYHLFHHRQQSYR